MTPNPLRVTDPLAGRFSSNEMLVFAPLPRCVTAAPYPGQDFALTPVDELPEGSEPDGSEPAEARTRKPLKLEPESVTVAVVPTMLAVS